MVSYVSTRGQAPQLGFSDAMMAGLATDGGLYVPAHVPQIDMNELAALPYLDVAARVMTPFIGDDIPPADLARMLRAAYASFDTPEVAPLTALEDGHFLLELFHGPTLAFKDVALQFLGQCFDRVLAASGRKVTVIGATSGDTGSAAIEAFRGKDTATIFILHPQGRVSDVQRRQMTTVADENVFNIAVEGSFDDCQRLVKEMFADAEMRDTLNLSAVNSINWARILAQAVYYVYASTRLHARTGRHVTFAVPTGNFGNVYAGHVARAMGAPIDKLLVATNSNDILHRFFATGTMQAHGVVPTLSPSMDIQAASNFERLLFDLCGRDGAAVAQLMAQFRETGAFMLDATSLRALFASGRQDDAETLAVIGDVYKKTGRLIDPHTAVGVGVARGYRAQAPDSLIVTLATAHPAKFPDAVARATGVAPPVPPRLQALDGLPERLTVLPADAARVKDWVRARAMPLVKRG